MKATNCYPRLRAPVESGNVLCEPSWETLINWANNSRNQAQLENVELFGEPISELSIRARRSTVTAAEAYTSQYLDLTGNAQIESPLIMTGHQPELFHPGVWYKNFSAARLAELTNGRAINLIIDSDLCRTSAIRVPAGNRSNPRVESVAFDEPTKKLPYEELSVGSKELWCTFGQRVSRTIEPLVKNPLIHQWWPNVCDQNSPTLGLSLSQARHQLEHAWGSRSYELPLSLLCQTEVFRLFTLHLFLHAARFRSVYNDILENYRLAHRLRNHVRPVPNLHTENGWTETPFWVWTHPVSVRHPLFVRTQPSSFALTDFHEFEESFPLSSDAEPDNALSKLEELEGRGIKIRTRALSTTLFVRLFLADLFIHGIGGAKYDQVTDSLCQEFFGVTLPAYATISGTLRLPIEQIPQTLSSPSRLRQEIRDLVYHPERHFEQMELRPDEKTRIERLIAQKLQWAHTQKTPENFATKHREITKANTALQEKLTNRKESLEFQLEQSQLRQRALDILTSREYAFCLYPSEVLQEFLRV